VAAPAGELEHALACWPDVVALRIDRFSLLHGSRTPASSVIFGTFAG
jgi:hypothetical protein